jgi:hypothetical protein
MIWLPAFLTAAVIPPSVTWFFRVWLHFSWQEFCKRWVFIAVASAVLYVVQQLLLSQSAGALADGNELSGGPIGAEDRQWLARGADGKLRVENLPRAGWLPVRLIRAWRMARTSIGSSRASMDEAQELIRQFRAAGPLRTGEHSD